MINCFWFPWGILGLCSLQWNAAIQSGSGEQTLRLSLVEYNQKHRDVGFYSKLPQQSRFYY